MSTLQRLKLLLALLLICWSCTSGDDPCDPGFNCDIDRPLEGAFTIKLTIDSENPEVWVNVFYGDIDKQDTFFTDLIDESQVTYDFPVDNYYSVTAAYKRGSKTIIAVDGDWVRATQNTNCEFECWTTEPGGVNLRLID